MQTEQHQRSGRMWRNAVPGSGKSTGTIIDFENFLNKLPPFVARKNVTTVLGGAISPKTLANADSLGKGPEGRTTCGRTVVYETASLLKWMNSKRS